MGWLISLLNFSLKNAVLNWSSNLVVTRHDLSSKNWKYLLFAKKKKLGQSRQWHDWRPTLTDDNWKVSKPILDTMISKVTGHRHSLENYRLGTDLCGPLLNIFSLYTRVVLSYVGQDNITQLLLILHFFTVAKLLIKFIKFYRS